MKIRVKCFATLANEGNCDYRQAETVEVPGGTTVSSFLRFVGLARDAVKIAFVNNRIVAMDQPLEDGDRVAFAPAVGGM
ncbi:MAG: MoaD/ThiS family protein [Desulfobacterales bacterium]|nr:MoaD/ThiS family protein [Desulfobacterales bacterium]